MGHLHAQVLVDSLQRSERRNLRPRRSELRLQLVDLRLHCIDAVVVPLLRSKLRFERGLLQAEVLFAELQTPAVVLLRRLGVLASARPHVLELPVEQRARRRPTAQVIAAKLLDELGVLQRLVHHVAEHRARHFAHEVAKFGLFAHALQLLLQKLLDILHLGHVHRDAVQTVRQLAHVLDVPVLDAAHPALHLRHGIVADRHAARNRIPDHPSLRQRKARVRPDAPRDRLQNRNHRGDLQQRKLRVTRAELRQPARPPAGARVRGQRGLPLPAVRHLQRVGQVPTKRRSGDRVAARILDRSLKVVARHLPPPSPRRTLRRRRWRSRHRRWRTLLLARLTRHLAQTKKTNNKHGPPLAVRSIGS